MSRELTVEELEKGLDEIRQAPKDEGVLKLIVRRPEVEVREVLQAGELNPTEGLAGDNWKQRGSARTPDGSADPDRQITLMSARVIGLLAQDPERWPLAGDQLYVDMDLSEENLPSGTRLALGGAVIEITEPPHTGCAKFSSRFGLDALKFVSTPEGKALRLRGVYARVVRPGVVRVGDPIQKR